MSTRTDRGGGGGGGGGGRGGQKKLTFLSAHRCPEVDLLPNLTTATEIPPPRELVPPVEQQEQNSEFTCTVSSDADYLDIYSSCHSSSSSLSEEEERVEEEEEEEEEEGQEEEGRFSDWSEEDLSLHFSPSVILPSDDEESDPESGFECVDITLDNQVKGQERGGLRMVPKRQIQLKRRDSEEPIKPDKQDKPELVLKDGVHSGGGGRRGGAKSVMSANQLYQPPLRAHPEMLRRQHSMPTSLKEHSEANTEDCNNKIYKGLIAAHQ
ncbi:hypothetical protein LDENG_00274350, partial [Lucifuga dentata]